MRLTVRIHLQQIMGFSFLTRTSCCREKTWTRTLDIFFKQFTMYVDIRERARISFQIHFHFQYFRTLISDN